MTTVTVTRKGQTTIPKELRDKYDMFQGAKLQVIDTGDAQKSAVNSRPDW